MKPPTNMHNPTPNEIATKRLVAHRGYPVCYPDNSLAGIQAAIKAGAKFIEVDIQLSSDHLPVLFHDRDLERMCGTGGSVHQYSMHELGKLDASEASKFGGQFAGTPIPSLNELCELLPQYPDVSLFAEIKRISIEQFGADAVWKSVSDRLLRIRPQTIVISFNIEILLLAQRDGWPVGVVLEKWQDQFTDRIAPLRPAFVFIELNELPDDDLSACVGDRLVVYDIVNPALVNDVIGRGVSLVETFDIGGMLAALRR